jgi:sugar-specific transcriptional regulator TrmB
MINIHYSHKVRSSVSVKELSYEDDTQTLSGLGITVSQGKVYLALLRLKTASRVHIIAKFTDIPRQDLYRLLDELLHLGIVQKTLVKPATFKATPPTEAVRILIRRKRGEFSRMEREANKFVKRASELLTETQTEVEKDQFLLIADREAIICKAMQVTENTKATLKDITPFSEFVPWLAVLSESIDEALKKGVKFQWLTDKPADANLLPKSLQTIINHPNFSLRFIPSAPKVKLGIFDNKEVLLGIFAKTGFALSPCLWSNNPSLVTIADSHFETWWKKGIDIKFEV